MLTVVDNDARREQKKNRRKNAPEPRAMLDLFYFIFFLF